MNDANPADKRIFRQGLSLLLKRDRKFKQLVAANNIEIKKYNENTLSTLSLLSALLMLLPLMAVPFSNTKRAAVPVYIAITISATLLFIIFKWDRMKKYTMVGIYALSSIFFSFAIYLSVIHTPNMRATVLLVAFCMVPITFIDRPLRMNIFVAFWLIIHSLLAFKLKPQYALDDSINSISFAILSLVVGNRLIWTRVRSYEAQRLLVIQKETDVLTGLNNRRKLFQTMAVLEAGGSDKPSGVLMIDIDKFKEFNDSYGHAAGDRCLQSCGHVFAKFSADYDIDFYRYGGEEFVALAYGYDEKELLALAEKIRTTVENERMDELNTTISVGIAYSAKEEVRNYEHVIDQADKAVYRAKSLGRNKVCMSQFDPDLYDAGQPRHSH